MGSIGSIGPLESGAFFDHWHSIFPHAAGNPEILVGFSGGPDSFALLHLMHSCCIRIAAAHLNHSMRPEAEGQAEALAKECEKLNIPFFLGTDDVPQLAAQEKIGIEEAGRKARYRFFDRVLQGSTAQFIATAHTLDDQVETFLLNVARGAGLHGLSGIPSFNGRIIRPLLHVTKAQTQAYCERHHLPTIHDPANDSLQFSRVRMRQNVVPELLKINPYFKENLARSMEMWGEEDAFLDANAAHSLAPIAIPLNGRLGFVTLADELAVDRDGFFAIHPVLRARAARLVVRRLGGRLDSAQTAAIVAGDEKPSGSVTAEGARAAAAWNEKTVHFEVLDHETVPMTAVPDEGYVDDGWQAWTLRHRSASGPAPSRARHDLSLIYSRSRVRLPLHIRSPRPGEKIVPEGSDCHRKISDLLSEAGLSRLARRRLPVVCDVAGPIWIPGICADSRALEGDGPWGQLNFEPTQAV